MQRRAATAPEELDYFPTPPWAARAGAELIKTLDPEALTCLEPACGGGHMVHGLKDYFTHVYASDVFFHESPVEFPRSVLDFLSPDVRLGRVDWIITNPPFKVAADFVRLGLERASRGVAMLLRIAFLEGQARHPLLYGETPVTVVAPFAERVPMVKGRWDPAASSATAYAWFIWLKPSVNPFRDAPVLRPIAPGAKARLTKPDDARLFGVAGDAPLFGGL
jgi:hypothetical protein